MSSTCLPIAYYEDLAEELEQLSKFVSSNPRVEEHFAERLKNLAQQLRDDTKLMRLKSSKT